MGRYSGCPTIEKSQMRREEPGWQCGLHHDHNIVSAINWWEGGGPSHLSCVQQLFNPINWRASLMPQFRMLSLTRFWRSFVAKMIQNDVVTPQGFPVKNLSSQLTHFQLTLKLMERSFWGHLVSSQWTHKMSPHCELAVSPPWVCNSHHELAVSYLWDHPMSSPCSGSSELTVRVANSREAYCKLTVWAHLVSSLWANRVSSKWAYSEFKCELPMSWLWAKWVSSKWAHREIIQVSPMWVWC